MKHFFWTLGGFACIHSLLFLAKRISASLPAGRSPEERRAEQSLPAPHFPKQSISYASATFIYRPSSQITFPSVSPVQTRCILPAWAGTAHFVWQLSVLVAPVQLLHFTVPLQLKGTVIWMVLNRILLANFNRDWGKL